MLLSLCVASLGRAMQRQADNRNYLVTQVNSTPYTRAASSADIVKAFGFLARYRSLRGSTADDEFADEVEYNFGRAFHQLGLLSHISLLPLLSHNGRCRSRSSELLCRAVLRGRCTPTTTTTQEPPKEQPTRFRATTAWRCIDTSTITSTTPIGIPTATCPSPNAAN